MSRPASPFITCYCSGHCPDNKPNGTCIAKFGSYCFTAIEEVYDSERNSYEFEKSYGCLPPEEGGLMQCKGNLVPHEVPKSIICCNNASYCNLNLEPELPDGIGGIVPPNYYDTLHLICFLISSFIILILLGILICYAKNKYKCYRDKIDRKNSLYDETHNFCPSYEKCPNLFIDPSISSGSGSGLPILVHRTVGKQIELTKSIGKGRYGEVWKAVWRGDEYAVKVFFTTEEESWHRETSIYQTVLLRHPNILGFVAADIRGTGSWTQLLLITDYHDNGSLHDYLKNHELDTSAGLKLAHSAICGIFHLHTEIFGKQGKPAIAHRDIKSKNILVKKDGTCAIADLNLSIRYDSMSKEPDVLPHIRVGTKRYMAPEVLNQTIVVTNFDLFKMADMYSYGLVLWEIARRIKVDGHADEYMVPYADYVQNDPSFEEMEKLVCEMNIRPSLSPLWNECPVLNQMSKVMQECWHSAPCVRLTSLRVKKTLAKLRSSYDIKKI